MGLRSQGAKIFIKPLNSGYYIVVTMNENGVERVSEDFLIGLFSSDPFIQTNLKAARKTERTGHETGYNIFKRIGQEKITLSSVVEGTSDSMEGTAEQFEKHHKSLIYDQSIYPLIQAHFHPNFSMIPSPDDLFVNSVTMNAIPLKTGYKAKPISIIGRSYKDVDLLIYQIRFPEAATQALDEQLMEELRDYDFNNDYAEKETDYPFRIADKMKSSGLYEATVMKILKNGQYFFDPAEIRKFAFSIPRTESAISEELRSYE
jgi:hypothetical protein